MADDIENDDQWLYGDNQEPESEPAKNTENELSEPEAPKENKSPTVSFCCVS